MVVLSGSVCIGGQIVYGCWHTLIILLPSVNMHARPINGTVHNACMAHAYAQESMVARIATEYFEIATAFICPGIYQA